MDNLETIMQDRELVKKAVKRLLIDDHCPSEYGLPVLDNCPGDKGYKCTECWTKALKNQD